MLERLEKLPVGSFQYKLLVVTGLGWLFDSMDTGLIAFVLPILSKEWGLTPEQVGWIGSIGLIGMALGAVLAGTLADKFGRKNIFAVTIVLYSVATGLCAVAWNYESLLVFRFLVGFGLGGELPVAATLMTEYAPTKLRGRFIVLLESFWGVGWLVAVLISYLIIPKFGWQAGFIIGALPALYVFVIRLHVPESIRYLISKGKVDEARNIILTLEKKLSVKSEPFAEELSSVESASEKNNVPSKFSSLWSPQFFGRTLMLWLAWFGIVYSYYGIFMWLPSIVFAQGFEVVKTFEYVLIMTLAQLPGYFAAAWLVDVIGRRYTLSSFLLMSGVCAYFFGNAATPTELLMWGAAMSFFNLGAWGVIYTYTPELYPTSIRALGSGCAAGFGRIGGMLAPMFVGILLANGVQMNLIFAMFAAVFILISLIVVGLDIESKQKSLEEIEKFAKEFNLRTIDEYISFPRPQKLDFVIGLVVLVIFYFCWEFYIPLSETGKYTKDIELGYNAKQDERGFYYVVDSGHSRLICFDEDSKIKCLLNNVSDGESTGLYIDDFAVDKGLTYVSASEWNGMLLSKEVILVFDKEKYVRTITTRDYSNDTINKHRFYGITVSDNVLRYVEVDKAVIFVHSVNLETDEDKVKRVEYNNAFNSIGDCAFYGDKLYVLNKSGIINSINEGKFEQVYSTKWQNEAERVPYSIAVSKDGTIYFTDIRGRTIVKADVATKSTKNLFEQTDSLTINLTNLANEGNGFLLVDSDGVKVISDTGTKTFLTLEENDNQIIFKTIYTVAVMILGFLLLLLIYRVSIMVLSNKPTTVKLIALTMLVVVCVVSAVVCKLQIDKFSETYRHEIMAKLENSAYILVNQMPAGIIDKINNAADFDSEAYNTLCQVMENAFPMNVEINRQIYCNILRLDKSGEKAYSIAYLDRSIGVYFPLLDQTETEDVKKLYQENSNAKGALPHLWNLGVADASGEYISLKVPIYDNNEIEGIVSLGTDISFIQDQIREITFQMFLSTIIILMLVWLGVAEAVAWFEGKQTFEKALESGKTDALPSHFIRLLIFTIFICVNLTSTFLPVWIIHNSGEFQGAELEFMASLPFTVNIFVMGVMSLVTPTLIKHLGMGHLLAISSIAALYGNLIMFLIPGSYSIIFFGLIMDGIGVGLVTNATYVLLTYIRDEEEKQRGFNVYNIASLTGSNFGMMLGSVLAVLLSQRITFLIVALIWLSIMVTTSIILWQLKNLLESNQDEEEEQSSSISFRRFLVNKPVMSFFVMIQNPYILFNGFIFFFIPMFCEEHGYNEIIVSMLMMLYSEVAVLSDSNLSERMENLKGHMGMYIAYFLNIAAVLLFAFTNNLLGVVLAMTIMGVAAGFGKPLQQTWFLKQKPVQQYGEDKAMGVYNFTENIGESLGPMVFSRIMVMEPLIASVSSFCAVIAASGVGHMILNKKELTEADKAVKEGDS